MCKNRTNILRGEANASWKNPRLSHALKDNWLFLAEITITILLCVVHSIASGHYANFYPINGTFQNYNPVRRLLSGQIPYKDFQDYLGLGHLYVGSLFTRIFGGTYRASLIAFSFLTFSGLALISYMVAMAIFNQKEKAVVVSNIILVIILIQPKIFTNALSGTSEIMDALNYALGTGNSARFVRGTILPISVFAIWLGYFVYCKMAEKYRRIYDHKNLISCIGIGLIAGIGFAWSNDYGISCWVCLFIMTFWVRLCQSRRLLKASANAVLELIASFFGIFATVEICTVGNFQEWFSATFGTGGYQSWYYNSSKSYYLYDVDFTYIMLIQAGICIVYLVKMFMEYNSVYTIRRYGILAFANMTCFCAVNEYKMLSGGVSREVALAVLFMTIVYEVFNLCSKLKEERYIKMIASVSAVLCISWVIANVKEEFIFKFMTDKDGVYVDALGGNLTSLGDEIIETELFLDGEDFFATYSSAQEVVNNSFQPSGTDYIIHVLGDEQRKKYLESFENDDFKYVATIKETYTDWEYWVQRANWFFYRELYQNWHPVYANSYELYWEKNTINEENSIISGYEVEIIDVNEYSKKIIVNCNDFINGIADVYIDAKVNVIGGLSTKLVFSKNIKVENTGVVYAQNGSYYESNYLRPETQEYIPIPIINGYGEVLISSGPSRNTSLVLNNVSCERIYTVTSDFVEVTGSGVNESGQVVFSILKSDKNSNAISDIQSVEFKGIKYNVIGTSDDGNAIYILTDEVDEFPIIEKSYGNYMKLRR